jgi:L-ascorbate metabolism protein UlaG (beta-lactamase superfamily)
VADSKPDLPLVAAKLRGVIRGDVRFFLFLMLSTQAFAGGLEPYAGLILADSPGAARDGVRVTYLGTNGYQFEFKGHALLVDPYFSRVDLLSVALGSRIQPNASRINDGLRHLASGNCRTDAILVTHGHFDHLLDVPAVMAKTRARLIASASSVRLAKRAGASSGDAVKPGDVRRIGPWKIRVLSATHDRLFGKVPFDRPPSQAGLSAEAAYSAEAAAKAGSAKAKPPQRAADWICGEPLAFLIEVNGQRIYIDSGGTPMQLPPNESGSRRMDLAILGMALPDSRARLYAALERLHPRYILPSHQDNFFRPLSAGFQFGSLTDFPSVRRECAKQNRSRLILLDYFKPWTLPTAANPKSQNPNPKQRVKSQFGNGRQKPSPAILKSERFNLHNQSVRS